jgi:hypothetical protein
MATPIERIDLIDHSGGSEDLVCAFFYSEGVGVTCSSAEHLQILVDTGIAAPPDGEIVFPKDGRRFFDALPVAFSGSLLRASQPRTVDHG